MARGQRPQDNASQRSWSIALGAGILIVATILAYLPAIRGGFIWDDPDYVLHNRNLRSAEGLLNIWLAPTSSPQYYPLVFTTFWIEQHLWGLEPPGYHLVNVLLHIASALLLWRILARLNVPGAWLGAVIFALHPVMVESVAWVTERKNVLSLLLYLGAGYVYLFRVIGDTDVKPQAEGRPQPVDPRMRLRGSFPWNWYALSLALFLGALFSKTVTASLPAAILLIVYWKRGRIGWRDLVPLVPFFSLGASLGAFTSYLEKTHVGASGEKIVELHLSLIQRCLIAGRAIWFYASKLVFPAKLAFIYPRWNEIDTPTLSQWFYPAGVIVVVLALFALRNRIGRGPLVAVLLFCGTLFPALGFVNVYPMRFSFVADHFQYHASIALIVLIAAGVTCVATKLGTGRGAFVALCAIVLAPLWILTWKQSHLYADALTLWRDTSQKNPGSWMVWTNLGNALVASKPPRYAEAIPYYFTARDLAPHVQETHWNAGNAYARLGDYDAAEAEFRETLRLDPDYPPALADLGQLLYYHKHDAAGAIELYRQALAIAPHYGKANALLATALQAQGDGEGAIEHYRRAIAADPDDRDAHYNLGTLLISRKQFDEAAYNFSEAVRIDPEYAEAWTNLGAAQLNLGQRDDAINSFKQALRIKPDLVPAQRGLDFATRGG